MIKGLTNPTTGKTYVYKGFVPLRRISDSCVAETHASCLSSPQILIEATQDFEFAKQFSCLCACHFTEEVK